MEVGDQVKIKKEWLNCNDEVGLTFTVVEVNDNRINIQVNKSGLRFVPIERVSARHIEKI